MKVKQYFFFKSIEVFEEQLQDMDSLKFKDKYEWKILSNGRRNA